MNKAQLLALYNQDQRIDITFPGMRREITPDVVRHVDTSEINDGMVIYSQLTEANADRVIREQMQYFERIGQDFEWKVYDYDQPSDLVNRLHEFEFEIEDAEAVEVLDLAAAPDIFWQPLRHDIRRITNPEQLVDVQAIEQQVWDEDASWVEYLLGEALRQYPDQMSIYVGYVDGQPALHGSSFQRAASLPACLAVLRLEGIAARGCTRLCWRYGRRKPGRARCAILQWTPCR